MGDVPHGRCKRFIYWKLKSTGHFADNKCPNLAGPLSQSPRYGEVDPLLQIFEFNQGDVPEVKAKGFECDENLRRCIVCSP